MKIECRIDGNTEIYGIFGYPVKHSKSPLFQTYSFQSLGINAVYLPFEVKPEDIEKAVNSIKILNIKGVNVTVPHKEEVIKYVDELSEEVKYIKAANTIHNIDGYLKAYNTDADGFIQAIKDIEPEFFSKKFLIIGAGGAARAIIYGLVKQRVQHILLANRTIEKAKSILQDFKTLHRFIEDIISLIPLTTVNDYIKDVDIIVNTTSVGLKEEDPWLFDYNLISQYHTVVDIIYKQTPLLRYAQKKGSKWQDGLPMLIYQGIKSFEIWTGKRPDVEKIKDFIK